MLSNVMEFYLFGNVTFLGNGFQMTFFNPLSALVVL